MKNSVKNSVKNSRRSFLKLVPMAGAAAALPAAPQGRQGQQGPIRVKKESMHAAEELMGIELTSAQEDMALRGVDRNLTGYESLRKIDIPLDTDPAVWFHPAYGARKVPSGPKRFRPTRAKPPAFKDIEDLAFASALELGALIRAKRITSMDLTKMYLGRLKKYGPGLLCVITLTEDLALELAAKADQEVRTGKIRGPLHGVPWGAKDLFAAKGYPTTWGAEPYQKQTIPYDAHVVERLREAGAVLVAKLSMGALAQGGRWFGGMTRDPWEPAETRQGSSGSSAGSAASTAAGLVGFSLGTETLGSIISPSTRCGVTGLRPTYGRVSRYGAMGLSWSMDKIGPLCRGVEDCAAVLNAIYGPDGRDLTVTDAPFNWNPAAVKLSQMRIGYVKAEFDSGDAETRKLHEDALEVLRRQGAKLEPVELPTFPANLTIILNAEAAAAFDDITRNGEVNTLAGQSAQDWPNSFRTARFIPAVEYIRAQRARTLLMRKMDEFMSKWDVFIAPPQRSASLTTTNLTGHPAVVVPCGFVKGLPRTIMFTGGLYDEASILAVALAYQRNTNWTAMHPELKEGPPQEAKI